MAFDIGNGIAGAATGFAAGGPIGAIGGGVLGLFGGGKKKRKAKKVSTLDKYQQALYGSQQDALTNNNGPLADLYNFDAEGANQDFDNMVARPAYRDFQEKTIPGITGAFRKSGTYNSSYTGQALSNAGRDVQESLNAQRAHTIYQGQNEARSNKRSAIENSLNRQTFAYTDENGSGNAVDDILKGAAPYVGDYFASYLKNRSPKTGGK